MTDPRAGSLKSGGVPLRLRCIVVVYYFQYGGERGRNRKILTEHSVKVGSFLFSFTIGTLNLIDFECEEVFFAYLMDNSQRQTQSLFFGM